MKEPVFASFVVYVYNDAGRVGPCLRELDAFALAHFASHEIVAVNDASTDSTAEELRATVQQLAGSLTVMNLSRRHGLELAMLAGLDRSMGDLVYEVDSCTPDFPLNVLEDMYRQAGEGFDIVAAGPRHISRRSRLFYALVNRASYLDMNLSTETVRLVSRRALNAMLNLREKVRYRKALYVYTGCPRTRIQYDYGPGTGPRPRHLNRETVSLALDIILSFSDWGLRAAHYLSLGFLAFSLLMLGYVVYNYLYNSVVEGWTTIMALLSIGFSGVFFILGILAEYIARILTEVRNRPAYTVSSSEVYHSQGPAREAAAAREPEA